MQKNKTLAMNILREKVKRIRFWRTTFIKTFSVVIIDRIIRKVGKTE